MKFNFRRKVLKNGMVLLLEKRNLPIISVAFAVKQGSINEELHEKGISHFIEHMLYKGTSKRSSKQIAVDIERNGGELNGFTSETITAFWCKMPSNHLNIALDVLSDMVKNPMMDEKELEKERQVIFEEMNLYKDNPLHYVFERIHQNLYKNPFGISIIGTHNSMNSITREKMLRKFQEVYKPNNMILCVVGDADFDHLEKFAEKNFRKENGKIKKVKLTEYNKSGVEKRKGVDQANLVFAYHVPCFNDKKSHAALLLNVLMAVGMSSRLFSEIREKRNMAYSVRGQSNIQRDFAYNSIYVGAKAENMPAIKKIIIKEFEEISKNLDEKELKQVKEQAIGNYYTALEDSHNQMANLLFNEANGNAKSVYDFEKDILGVKLKDVKEIARKAVKKNSSFVLIPEK